MENYVNKITEYLSHIEVFLTSVLLEETKVSVTNSKLLNAEDNFDQLSDEDIYLYTYDKCVS